MSRLINIIITYADRMRNAYIAAVLYACKGAHTESEREREIKRERER